MELETKRLILREISREDLDDITRILQDKTIYDHTLHIPYPYTKDHARAWLGQIEADRAQGRGWTFGIRRREDGRFIGAIGLSAFNAHDETEAGYWLEGAWRGQGYMTECLKKIIEFAFSKGAHRVSGRHFPFNPASGRVMEKAGMRCEGILRGALKKNGIYLDDVCWGIVAEDLAGPKAGS